MGKYSVDKVPSEVQADLAEKFRIIRKKAKYSQNELANRSGVSLGSLKRFELTGQISLESLLKLVFVLEHLSDFEQILIPKKDLSEIEALFNKKRK